jgi:hypothetical protein
MLIMKYRVSLKIGRQSGGDGDAEKFPRGAWLADRYLTLGNNTIKERPMSTSDKKIYFDLY